MWQTLVSGSAIAHLMIGAWSLVSTLAQGAPDGWTWAVMQVVGPCVAAGLVAALADTLGTPLPAVLSLPAMPANT